MITINYLGGMITFRICAFGYGQHVSRAKLDAKTASFTPVINNVYDTVSNLDAISI
jgi:hypothetical protein